jgi:hypothetical protein
MKTILVLILVGAAVAAAIYLATKKFGLFADKDKDGIPDKVEDAIAKGKRKARKVIKEIEDLKPAKKKPLRRRNKPATKKDYYKKSGTRKSPAKKTNKPSGKDYYKTKR